eukprot:294115-Pelagomonas_calceolata.AAC.8
MEANVLLCKARTRRLGAQALDCMENAAIDNLTKVWDGKNELLELSVLDNFLEFRAPIRGGGTCKRPMLVCAIHVLPWHAAISHGSHTAVMLPQAKAQRAVKTGSPTAEQELIQMVNSQALACPPPSSSPNLASTTAMSAGLIGSGSVAPLMGPPQDDLRQQAAAEEVQRLVVQGRQQEAINVGAYLLACAGAIRARRTLCSAICCRHDNSIGKANALMTMQPIPTPFHNLKSANSAFLLLFHVHREGIRGKAGRRIFLSWGYWPKCME